MVTVDQATKLWAVGNLSQKASSELLGDFIKLTLVYNEGGAMGTNFGSSIYYLVITLVILPVLVFYLYQHRGDLSFSLPLAFVVAGALGNLIDRFRYGRVVDFIDVDFFDIEAIGLTRWWTFNVADICISGAIIFLTFRLFIFPGHKKTVDGKAAQPADSSG
ncbi:MAG: signal peptidase II [Candidatus Zixiibacteriota bacterium]|nr:MAG: signal peptidase II [candidate division Zixibacteria bacterium]